jgi:hypothetical protein
LCGTIRKQAQNHSRPPGEEHGKGIEKVTMPIMQPLALPSGSFFYGGVSILFTTTQCHLPVFAFCSRSAFIRPTIQRT